MTCSLDIKTTEKLKPKNLKCTGREGSSDL